MESARATILRIGLFAFSLLLAPHFTVAAQMPMPQAHVAGCNPVSGRTDETGCWILFSRDLGQISESSVYWSLDKFATRADAESAKSPQGIVAEALGEFWVFTIGTEDAGPGKGERVTRIGPIPVHAGEAYTAQFMEAILPPNLPTRTHRHPGPEVFYTEQGESCLETPAGKRVGRKGSDIIIPEGEPMNLLTTGKETRRSIVLVLHPTSTPWMTLADDWTPKGLCRE